MSKFKNSLKKVYENELKKLKSANNVSKTWESRNSSIESVDHIDVSMNREFKDESDINC